MRKLQLVGKPVLNIMLMMFILVALGCSWYGRLHSAKGDPYAPVSEIPEGMAVVYIYGPLGYGNYNYPIVLNEKIIVTELKKGGYHPCIVGPGELKMTMIEWGGKQRKQAAGAAATGTITGGLATGIIMGAVAAFIPEVSHSTTLIIEPGKSYYVEHVGTLKLNLEEKTEEEAMPKLRECVLLPPFTIDR